MKLLNKTISTVFKKRQKALQNFRENPLAVYEKQLFKLLKKGKNTKYLKDCSEEKIKNINDFQNFIPVSDYTNLKKYIDRSLEGEKNVLWPGKVKWFAKSSGTTSSKSKFIPITRENLKKCHYQGGRDVLVSYYNNYPENNVFKGKTLTLGGSHQVNKINEWSRYGDLSAVLIHNLPFWIQAFRSPEKKIALMSEWEEKLKLISQQVIKDNITALAGVPSWFLVLLSQVLKDTQKEDLTQIWPNLELFIHGGISFEPYEKQYKNIIPNPNMHYLEVYNASEGFFALQDTKNREDGMLLMLDYGIFYEFIPLKEMDKENPKVLTLDQVELGENYALVITTSSGLWRYMVGDTVEFISLKPYRIKISGRTKHYINAFGEEVIVDNTDKALKLTCQKCQASVREYSVAPVFMETNKTGRHQWLIEFSQHPRDLQEFVYLLDKNLQALNSDYEAKRYKNFTLDMPEVLVAPRNIFYKWLEEKGKMGGQNKIPRLANNRKYMEEFLAIKHKLEN